MIFNFSYFRFICLFWLDIDGEHQALLASLVLSDMTQEKFDGALSPRGHSF